MTRNALEGHSNRGSSSRSTSTSTSNVPGMQQMQVHPWLLTMPNPDLESRFYQDASVQRCVGVLVTRRGITQQAASTPNWYRQHLPIVGHHRGRFCLLLLLLVAGSCPCLMRWSARRR